MINPLVDPVEEIEVAETHKQAVIPETPAPAPLPTQTDRKQQTKADNPKNKQFTGRCTEAEHFFITKAIGKRKKQLGINENTPYDAIRLLLDLIKKNNSDFLSPIKTN